MSSPNNPQPSPRTCSDCSVDIDTLSLHDHIQIHVQQEAVEMDKAWGKTTPYHLREQV